MPKKFYCLLSKDMSLTKATSIFNKYWGLMGKRCLAPDEALFIPNCNRIHTWFMKFPIDVVFVDAQGVIVRIFFNVKAWRTTPRVNKANGCLELGAGGATKLSLFVGKKCLIDEY